MRIGRAVFFYALEAETSETSETSALRDWALTGRRPAASILAMELILLLVLTGFVGLLIAFAYLLARIVRLEQAMGAMGRGQAGPAEPRRAAAEAGLAGPSPPARETPARETLASLFEQLVGGRLLIWIGGIALVVAGFFLIRHTIEIGLVTPELRMAAAALFGVLLLGCGEYARNRRFLADEPRIAQALVGAGIAVLYATAYGSWFLYGQIGGKTASALMLLISAAALALSLRHGPATAVMGMIGGFLTPWLAGDPEGGALPILAYIALLDAAIFFLAWRRGWGWIAAGAVALSFVWTAVLIFGSPPDALAAGLFVVGLALAASLLPSGESRPSAALQPLIIGLFELTLLVITLDTDPRAWLLFGSLAAIALWLGARRAEARFAPPVGLALALILLLIKAPIDRDPSVPWTAVAITLMFAGVSIPLSRKDRFLRTLTACAALVGPVLILRLLRPGLLSPFGWGLAAALLAVAALALLWLHRTDSAGRKLPDSAMVVAGVTAALLLAMAGFDLTPRDFVSATWLVIALALIAAGIRVPDKALRLAGLVLLTVTIFKVFVFDAAELQGALRILSFLGLGIALIAMGKLYGTVLRAERIVRESG
ncbi:MAG: hypothetical protein QOJ91_951 [Sphingomonadales bacterium]|nr:hypothetical protein [Sphingomonadales bacterium]